MTERINTLLHWIVEGEHKALRAPLDEKTLEDIRAQIQREDMPLSRRAARRLRLLLENERVHVRADERIPGIRTIPEFPDIYAEGEKERIFAGHFIHEQGACATFPPTTRRSARGSAASPRAGGTDACRGARRQGLPRGCHRDHRRGDRLCRPLRGGAAGWRS